MPRASHPTRTIGAAAVALIAILASVAGCTGGGGSGDARPSATASSTTPAPADGTSRTYVALGDSYTAGPGITPQQADSGFCGRSTENWPTRVAASLDLTLRDLSCSGATTSDLSATLASGAVPADASLVTVSAGGNDGGLFLSLLRACTAGSQQCRDFVTGKTPSILTQTTDELSSLLGDVRKQAPRARVLLVGYPRIAPPSGTCDALGIAADDVTSVLDAEMELEGALQRAAASAGVAYVSLRGPSVGHHACAGDQAWTNGVSPTAGDGIVLHPNARGMKAVAHVVADAARLPASG
ncbi:SGNH/GDSL hydrolase family protein [Aeromicrobium endophyticum]|uniref:SGNH/GDSL hydrolase family protein n=1 Tax=Aeromicrobium endophyticum TaxID=2292704 RepID=A0A371P2N6_9ACTN|nr:SGNH/GDSL hydrolase family protein [Aeromicrobium endophyticum]REK69810.1 SGNH/GDSL hydrolase family protein [Aeromicrobium endophyticum]